MSILLTIRETGFDPHEWSASRFESEREDSFPLLRGIMIAAPLSVALWVLIYFSFRWMLG